MSEQKKGSLFLFPNRLAEEDSCLSFFSLLAREAVEKIDGLIAESEKGARAFLKQFSFPAPKTFRDIPIRLLNEHTSQSELEELINPLKKGEAWGLISDCGLPCIADPGAQLVALSRSHHFEVNAFPGPSSVIQALMLSGLSAQSFAFHGYLERQPIPLVQQIKKLQQRAQQEKATQVFIETPYRNQKLFETLVQTLSDSTSLCLAWDLTLPSQQVLCHSVKEWKKKGTPDFHKKPAVFLIR